MIRSRGSVGCFTAIGAHGALPHDKLSAEMIYGYHDGKLIFVEPMVDVELLMAEEEITLEILQPTGLVPGTRYPTRFFMRYTDADYELVLTDFVDVE